MITKKIWPEYFHEILEGTKKYELRLADFDIAEGDVLLLEEWDPQTKEYSGRKIKVDVTYVLKTNDISFWPKEDVEKFGYQIISIEPHHE